MTVMLPIIAFLLLLFCFAARGITWRRAFLLAAISWGALLTASTELLSLCQGINRLSLSLFWGAVILCASIGFNRSRSKLRFIRPRRELILFFIPIGFILATTCLIAIVAPPNNWDSMTYHMGRVVHWIQNHSVAHYPTNIVRQLYFAPWAEFAIMHLQILSGGGDYFANLVQWFAFCGCIIGVSLITEQLGADRFRQMFAAVIAATIPMAILQSTSTQNDLVAAFWLVCFVYFGMHLLETGETRAAIPAGAALALAILTKGTAYLYALPFVVWFFLVLIRSNLRQLLKVTLIVSLAILILNGGHFMRNTALWGNPLARDIDNVQTSRRDLPALLSNISRNVVANTWTPLHTLNILQYRGMVGIHELLGIDFNDPATSLGAQFVPAPLSLHEDSAGNGLHTLLILSTLPVILLGIRKTVNTLPLRYLLALLGSIVLFSLLLKWQPWITRLHTPGFVLAAPLVAVATPWVQRKWVVVAIMALLLVTATPWLVSNESRPLFGVWTIFDADRNALYFASNRGLLLYYDQITESVANTPTCNNIAVYGDVDAYEYPLWAIIRSKRKSMPRIEHINVDNISSTIPLRDFTPCMQIKLLQTL
jgi:hypothetical protein